MKKLQFVALQLCLLFSLSAIGQTNPADYRQQLNDWHWQHNERYQELDSLEKIKLKKNPKANQRTGASPILYNFNCQDLWLSGSNIAWNEFGRDVGNGALDITYFENMFDDIKANGGNSMRWWLHTNVSFTPIIDASGYVSGLGTNVISEIQQVLDAAEQRDIAIDLCLFSFDMLQNQWEMDPSANRNFLTSTSNIQSYIDNALTPMVNAIKDHPALLCWEIFNEPEGMTNEFGWTPTRVDMSDIQRFVNMTTGAIHRLDSEHPVTNGSWSFRALTDILTGTDEMNYYRDDRLIAAGGDADGTLDFYQVHYYSWAGTALSPFHHDKSYWGLNKDLMVAEFHVEETFGVAANDLYDELYHRGYFGGWGWQYNETNLWNDIRPAMQQIYADHSSEIALDFSQGCSSDNITVRAVGTDGSEILELEIDGIVVATWTLSTSYQDYTYNGPSTGVFRLNYTNDATGRDVQVDYLEVDGVVYQAEDQSINTGYYANGSCGGGSNSELMHCSGYIEFTIQDCNLDSDSDGTNDCLDECPNDPNKIAEGNCGCGVAEGDCDNHIIWAYPGGDQGLAACKAKFLGNIMPSSWNGPVVRSDWGNYWNQVSPENAGKWGVAEGNRDQYSWGDLDEMYNYCEANNVPFKQHVFVWGSQQPSWIAGLSQQEQRDEVEEWYSLFAQRYPNTEIIDVVNESLPGHAPDVDFRDALGGFNNGASNPYLSAHPEYGPYGTGWDYIIYSFAKARDYFPDAVLVLNDYNIINNTNNINAHLEIVNILKDRGLVDAVGIQCHAFSVDNMTGTQVTNNLNLLASAGLPIHVTELDIRGDNGNEQQQRDRFADLFPAFYEHPAVACVTLWGYVEGLNWFDYTGLLNSDGSERMAMTWLKSYMASQPDVCNTQVSPTVSITAPNNGASFTSPTNITISATASDADGSITSVAFYADGVLIGTDNSSPYSINWNVTSAGSYDITAVATDNDGNATTSTAVSITVTSCSALSGTNDERCDAGTVSLAVSGGTGPYNWYTSSTGNSSIHTGSTYSPNISSTTTYYVGEGGTVTNESFGEVNQSASATIWNIDDFATSDKQIEITVTEELTLNAVYVYPSNNNTNVTLNIMQGGSSVASVTVNGLNTGKQKIDINQLLSPGTYILDAIGTSDQLEYQSEEGVFPYSISGKISFTGTEPWVISNGRYGMFYDWEVSYGEENSCPRTEVTGTIDPNGPTCNPDCNGDANGTASVDQCGVCSGGNTGVSPNSTCADCNGDANGTASVDQCAVCSGGNTGVTPNSTCADCNGDANGTASVDQCGVCSGGNTGVTPNSTCADCNGDANGTASVDQCGVCSGGNTGVTPNSTCADCNGDANGTASVDQCGVCSGGNTGVTPNSTCADCNGDANGTASVDQCGVCSGGNTGVTPNSTCADCNGDANGTASVDQCGVCSGGNTGVTPNSTCADCNGDANGTASVDQCGVCSGGNTGVTPNSTCADCNGDANGTASVDQCGVCSGGNTGITPNSTCADCNGDANGTASVDQCGVCSGGNTGVTPNSTCADCNGDANGTASVDQCGVCSGGNTGVTPNSTCSDCNGNANGTASVDQCGVCSGGNTGVTPNSTCADCNGNANGTASVDQCGVCSGGNTGVTPNSTCADCNGDANGTASVDQCGVCSGGNTGVTPNSTCVDCNGDINGTAFIDGCSQCVGGNTGQVSCDEDCNGDLGGTASVDQCGVCSGGNTGVTPNSTCADCNGDVNGSAAIDNCSICSGGNTGVVVDDCLTSINQSTINQSINVYPNPTFGIVHISEAKVWTVFNAQGTEVEHGEGDVISLDNYASGLYIIMIEGQVFKIEKY